MFLQASSVLLLSLLSIASVSSQFITVPNGGGWGDWGQIQWCPPKYVAKGYALKTETIQLFGDDTAVNGLRLYCRPCLNSKPETTITSSVGPWGSWTFTAVCTSGFLVAFQMKVEPPQGSGDDTAVNNIKFKCSNGQVLTVPGLPWGTYGSWSQSCPYGVCGIQTRVEKEQGSGDDTALNDVKLFCCSKENCNN